MTTARYLIEVEQLIGARAGLALTLDGEEGRHAATVRRTRVGERVDLADGAGRVAHCVVDQVHRDRLMVTVETIDDVPPRVPRLLLVQALAKGGRDELAIETATELGVDGIIPWQAARSVVQWQGERAERSRRRWQATVRAAAKQSRRVSVPSIEPAVTTSELIRRPGFDGAALVLHEEATTSLWAAVEVPPAVPELWVIVGPEGGIGADELGVLTAAGARPVRLGPEVLRTSSAGAAALAVLSVRLGRWSRD